MPAHLTVRNTGYIPDEFDERDKPYYYRGKTHNPDDFQQANLWKDHREWLEQIYDQHDSSSCVANATAAALRYLGHRVAEETKRPSFSVDPSRLFIYYNARATSYIESNDAKDRSWPPADAIEDGGTYNRAAMKAVNLFGIASEKAWPFLDQNSIVLGVNDRPPEAAYADAQGVRSFEYFRLDPDNNDAVNTVLTPEERRAVGRVTLARLKQCLVEGYPVVFGFNFYWEGDQWVPKKNDLPKEEEDEAYESLPEIDAQYADKPTPEFNGKFRRHTVLAVGFQNRDNPELKHLGGGRVLCQNSWGSSDHALFWMSYNWILEYWATSDFWMVRQLETPDKGSSTLELPQGSTWSLLRDMPDNKEQVAAGGQRRTVAMASYETRNFSFGAWWIAPDGSVQGANYIPTAGGLGGPPNAPDLPKQQPPAVPAALMKGADPESGWSRYLIRGPGTAAVGGGIAASTALVPMDKGDHQHRVDVVWINADGSVQGAANIAGYFNFFYEIARAERALPGGALSHLCRVGDGSDGDVAWLGKNGSVRWASRSRNGGQWLEREVAGPGAAIPESGLAVASTGADHLAVFWTDNGGTVRGRTWQGTTDAGSWAGTVYAVSDEGEAARSSRIAAVSRRRDGSGGGGVDVLFLTPSGILGLRTLVGSGGGLWKQQLPPRNQMGEVQPRQFRARVDSDIRAAVVGKAGTFEVVWIGPDNALKSVRISESNIASKEKVEEVVQPGGVEAGSPLGAVSITSGRLWVAFRSYDHELVVATHEKQ